MFKSHPIKAFGVPRLLAGLLRGALVSGPVNQEQSATFPRGRLSDGEWIPQPTVGLSLICSFPKAK